MERKEAIEVVKNNFPHSSFTMLREALETLIPELKESEDERIRKALIENFKFYGGDFLKTSKWGKNDDLLVTDIIAWLEKQGEQKSVDKTEPKFHEGEWVVQGHNILKILCVGNEYYCFETVGGYRDDMLISEIDSLYHLWTIEDAKDGDVLVASDGSIFLFAGVIDCACKYYCALTTDNGVKINKEIEVGYWETSRAVHPATKEQRDILFTKMKEAGYEWDSENKVLKKI